MDNNSPLPLSFTFLSEEQTRIIAKDFGTPTYVYSESLILERCSMLCSMPNAFGIRPRFAMKACPTAAVIQTIARNGVGIDASSGYEVERALHFGIQAKDISLTAQELPTNLRQLLEMGVDVNACSLHQLRIVGEILATLSSRPKDVGVRFNPGLGSGHSNRTNVGGPSSGFGVWKDYLMDVADTANKHSLRITRVHSHIGSGADPQIWENCARLTLSLATQLPDVTTVSLGGGFKVSRMPGEPESDLKITGEKVTQEFIRVANKTGRKFSLEIEPGAFVMARCGALVSKVIDLVDTGADGYRFIKLDTGMTEIIRPAMYGAQHPIIVVTKNPSAQPRPVNDFLVIGHCCESGDILTPSPSNPETLAPRALVTPEIGDYIVIGSTGAYTSGFSAVNYNSFPAAAEAMIRTDTTIVKIRERQKVTQVFENDVPLLK